MTASLQDSVPARTPGLKCLWRSDGVACLIAAAVTFALQAALLLALRAADLGDRPVLISILAVSALWTALSSGSFAAGASGSVGGFLRGGAAVDASGGFLLLLCALTDLPFLSALKIYCVLAAMAVFSSAVVSLGRQRAWRLALAVAAGAVLVVTMASPLWAPALLEIGALRQAALGTAVYSNSLYSIWSVEGVRYIWHESGMMYRLSGIRDFAPPAPQWWAPVAIYGGSAAAFVFVAWLCRRLFSRQPAQTPLP